MASSLVHKAAGQFASYHYTNRPYFTLLYLLCNILSVSVTSTMLSAIIANLYINQNDTVIFNVLLKWHTSYIFVTLIQITVPDSLGCTVYFVALCIFRCNMQCDYK